MELGVRLVELTGSCRNLGGSQSGLEVLCQSGRYELGRLLGRSCGGFFGLAPSADDGDGIGDVPLTALPPPLVVVFVIATADSTPAPAGVGVGPTRSVSTVTLVIKERVAVSSG